ncbi:MAG: YidC/Oxa1 family membrane protein insertase [Ruminococcaceae bacterium]|nr:YidC/Oxa1 family membrane protein insertase [Oscillospiraceae bacterium]
MAGIYEGIRAILLPFFSIPLSWFYDWTGSYVLAIFLLTLVIRLFLLPVSIKQQKNSAKQTRLNAKVNRIRQKYANNPQKAQQEIQELYQREGFGAANMGCMPMMIQMIVMIGLYGVMYKPLSSVLRFSDEKITAIKSVMQTALDAAAKNSKRGSVDMHEINILKNYKDFTAELTEEIGAESLNELAEFSEKFTFLGLDLSVTPDKGNFNAYWLIPILACATALLSSIYLYLKQRKQNPEMAKNPAMGCMTLMSPLMSLIFTFMFPTGVGVYWIISNILSFVQQIGISIFYSPKKVIAQQMVDETVVRRSKENTTKLRVENEKK